MSDLLKLGKTWTTFKAIAASKGLLIQYDADVWDDSYYVFAIDDRILYEVRVQKDGGADVTDFESRKTGYNLRLSPQLDSDNAPMSRTKVAPSGWSYQLHMFEFITSTVGSLVNNDPAGTALTDAVVTYRDAANTIITDPANQGGCVKTTIDIEPPYDYYITGGNIRMASAPTQDIYAYVIGVPDIPAAYGGSKSFVQNVNLKYINPLAGVNADGRAAKWLQYSATYHTNKLRFMFKHAAGYQLGLAVFLEIYKL